MPEGRLIKRKIADSERVNRQPVPARLLYDRLFLFADKEGRHHANPRLLLRRFFPLDDFTDEDMQGWLQGLHDAKKNGVGLIELYEVEGMKYMWIPGFLGEQSKTWLHGARNTEAESTIPPPPTLKEKRIAIAETIETVIPTPFELDLQQVIQSIPGWEIEETEDLVWIRSLSEDFPNLTVDNLKACRDYHSNKPETKGPWKNRIRNWLKHEQEYGKEAKGGASRKNPRTLRDRTTYTDLDNT